MQCKLSLLRSKLGQFGLNPMDWCVEIRARHGRLMHLEITSNADEAFRFEGWAEQGNWLTLVMHEI